MARPRQITEEEIRSILSADEALAAVRAAHRALAEGTAVNTPRTRTRTPKLSLHTMSAASMELGYAATKVYSATARGTESRLLLFSLADGALIAELEANELGRFRTAAAAALAAGMLAPSGADTLALIGGGYQAEGIVRAYLAQSSGLHVRRIVTYSRSEQARKAFAEKMAAAYGAQIEAVDSAADACAQAQLLVTATTSSEPVVRPEMLQQIQQISAIGSNALSRRELPARALSAASLLVVDEIETARLESGNLLPLIENGKVQWAALMTLAELVAGSAFVPASTQGCRVFLSHGMAVQDLYLGAAVVKLLS